MLHAKAYSLVKTITKKHDSKLAKKLNKEVALIKVKLASAKDPERKAALKAQLKIAKKILALKKLYAKAPESKKAEIRAKIVAKQEKL
jgi:hypothetical protein